MFTGLVSAIGRVTAIRADDGGGRDVDLAAPYRGLAVGESIAIDGACLTVARKLRGGFRVHVIRTTMDRTLFGTFRVGTRVNLERAARVGDRLGGHLVQGHVDGIARVVKTARRGDAWLVDLAVPAAVDRVSIPLGSITVAGVSLTVNARPRSGIIQVSLIPHTLAVTTLGGLEVGSRVHVEGDVIGKYVREFVRAARR
ncbi:MAG: riboflavin synthase [Gemmatimonadales bacterium]|nr:riboflavin synthase [Gemmatimonadales bacterium]